MKRLAQQVGLGGLAGLAVFALEDLGMLAAVGSAAAATPNVLWPYAAGGALFGPAAARLAAWRGSGSRNAAAWAGGLLGVVAVALAIRASQLALGMGAGIAAGLAALAGLAGLVVLLRRLAPRPAVLAPSLAAAAVSGAMVVLDRFHDPFAPGALAAAVALCAGAGAIAALTRAPLRVRGVAVGAALAAGFAFFMTRSGEEAAPAAGETPNVVLVVIDTLRDDVFRSVLAETEEGRALGRVLSGSAFFTNAIAAAPWTPPSVGSLLTGRHPREHGFEQRPIEGDAYGRRPLTPLAPSVPTLAEGLRARGYWTEALVTNPHFQLGSGVERGFARYKQLLCVARLLPFRRAVTRFVDPPACPQYEDAVAVRARLEARIGALADRQPFFLWLHLLDPHTPFFPHEDLAPEPGTEALSELDRLYRREVRFCARELAGMLESLGAGGVLANAVVALVSDHGEILPDDRREAVTIASDGDTKALGHGHLTYGELVRVPLVIRPPGGLPADHAVTALASHVDLPITIADLLGLDLDLASADSVSLEPWLRQAPGDHTDSRSFALVSSTSDGPVREAIRTDTHHLVFYPNGERPPELYDLRIDRGERRDLSTEQPERVALLLATLEQARAKLVSAGETQPLSLSNETREQLEAIGYVE